MTSAEQAQFQRLEAENAALREQLAVALARSRSKDTRMNRPGSLAPPSPDAERGGRMSPSQQRWKRLLWSGLLLGIGLVVLLGVFGGLLQRGPPPLRSDPNTLYLATSSQDLSFWSLPSQWHWQAFDNFIVAPYQPTGEALEIDAQITDAGAGLHDDDFFGIAIGMDQQGAGYVCGITLDQPILSSPGGGQGWDQSTIQGETTSGVVGNFSTYVTVAVTIQNNSITLFYDGKRIAQATATAYHANGLIGLFASASTSAKVRGFRIESLS
jgi:hypothetical protein